MQINKDYLNRDLLKYEIEQKEHGYIQSIVVVISAPIINKQSEKEIIEKEEELKTHEGKTYEEDSDEEKEVKAIRARIGQLQSTIKMNNFNAKGHKESMESSEEILKQLNEI